ncbi:hypothetical protein EUBVEN_02697 [Eubacterium ventriosum ATCC 27560]|uniref:Uncharacterized protein n=1 Tax=Eubacterium ventriosum ATCC 27560 TaxID=411463 RepID=A5ZAF0_9FIRM|nr:hypothetical protein EUBVEN_02697 [Eubacterium ventriosum ATCC 27560]
MFNTINCCDSVTNPDDCSNFLVLTYCIVVLYLCF